MVPYCPYGCLLSLWFPIVPMVPYCPGSIIVLDPDCSGSILSWFHFVLDPFCPGSILSHFVRSKRSALTRKYKARTWAMECHWQRTTFPANGTKNWKNKKIGRKFEKNKFYEGIGSRFEQMNKSKNEIELFLISSWSGRTDMPKYLVLGSFWKDK